MWGIADCEQSWARPGRQPLLESGSCSLPFVSPNAESDIYEHCGGNGRSRRFDVICNTAEG